MTLTVKRTIPTVLLAGLVLFLIGLASLAAQAQESPAEAKQLFAQAANLQNNGAFDVAAEDYQKFLSDFPQDPLAAKARHYLGVCQLQLKQHDKAAASFAEVIAKHPKFELIEDAYLNLGASQFALAAAGDKEMHANAAATFAKLAELFPKSKHLGEALYFQG